MQININELAKNAITSPFPIFALTDKVTVTVVYLQCVYIQLLLTHPCLLGQGKDSISQCQLYFLHDTFTLY